MAYGGILDQGIVLRAISCIGAQNSFFIHTQLHSVSYSIPIRVIGRVLQTFSKQKPSIPWKVLTWFALCTKHVIKHFMSYAPVHCHCPSFYPVVSIICVSNHFCRCMGKVCLMVAQICLREIPIVLIIYSLLYLSERGTVHQNVSCVCKNLRDKKEEHIIPNSQTAIRQLISTKHIHL